jgi:ABC-2 type transport system ATP-binding protein
LIALMSEFAIECRALEKRYGSVVAVDGIDLEVRSGECFGMLGPNGAGKTTTIEMIQGLIEPDAGQVRVLGLGWEKDEPELRQRIGTQLQETKFSEKLTVRETLSLFRSFYRSGNSLDKVLETVQLTEKARSWVGKLSGGQRQRLSVACALICEPDLLFLDEPTTGLDPQSRRQLWDTISAFRRAGGTVLLTTHYMEEASQLCDRVAIVDHGRIIALGSPNELIASLGAEDVVEFGFEGVGTLDDRDLEALPGVQDVGHEDGKVWLSARRVHQTIPALMALMKDRNLTLNELVTHRASLEDVFLQLTGRHLRDE